MEERNGFYCKWEVTGLDKDLKPNIIWNYLHFKSFANRKEYNLYNWHIQLYIYIYDTFWLDTI